MQEKFMKRKGENKGEREKVKEKGRKRRKQRQKEIKIERKRKRYRYRGCLRGKQSKSKKQLFLTFTWIVASAGNF